MGDAAVALLGLGYQSHLESGLELLGRADPQPLFERYFSPSPRVEFAIGCRGLVNAAIDISDGLLSDLSHILRASGLGAEIEEVTLPSSATAQACLSEKMLLQACLNAIIVLLIGSSIICLLTIILYLVTLALAC